MITLHQLYQNPLYLVLVILGFTLWSLLWKGMALWFAGKNRQKGWFIALLLLNTAGILPIIYLLAFRPKIDRDVEDAILFENEKVVAKEKKKSKKEPKNTLKEESAEEELTETEKYIQI